MIGGHDDICVMRHLRTNIRGGRRRRAYRTSSRRRCRRPRERLAPRRAPVALAPPSPRPPDIAGARLEVATNSKASTVRKARMSRCSWRCWDGPTLRDAICPSGDGRPLVGCPADLQRRPHRTSGGAARSSRDRPPFARRSRVYDPGNLIDEIGAGRRKCNARARWACVRVFSGIEQIRPDDAVPTRISCSRVRGIVVGSVPNSGISAS